MGDILSQITHDLISELLQYLFYNLFLRLYFFAVDLLLNSIDYFNDSVNDP